MTTAGGRIRRRLRAAVLLPVAAALLLAPPPSRAEEAPPEIRRTAVYTYETGERVLRSPLAIARDAKGGELVVSSFEAGEVVLLDESGALIKRIGSQAGLVTPYGVAVDPAGRIYVSELRTGRLKVLSPGGILIDQIDLGSAMGRTVSPGRVTLGEGGLVYVADLAGNEILVLDGRGDLVRSLGTFDYLQKAGPAGQRRIVGLSAMGTAVKLFSGEGALLRSFGEHGDEAEKNISFPTGFAVDGRGRLWIADAFQHRLKVFSMQGEFLFNVGRVEERAGDGGFLFPVDLCFGEEGELFVLEKGADRIQVFRVGDLQEGK